MLWTKNAVAEATTTASEETAKTVGELISTWFHSIKQMIIAEFQQLNISAVKAVEIVSYVGVGFFVGFLFKKYFRYVLFVMAGYIAFTMLLQNADFIIIDWSKLQQLFGLAQGETVQSLIDTYWVWTKEHVVVVISIFVGFLLGYKIG